MSVTRILIVEDESIVAMEIRDRLTLLGYEVAAVVSTGREAIEMAGKEMPDLVLMDIMLQEEMDGIEAAQEIRRRFDIPCIYITAYSDQQTLQRAKISEPFGYLLKPFEERELHSTIEMALYKHKTERKLKESEKWLATTLRCIGDAVIATNRDGKIKLLNPIAETLTGYSQEEALGCHLSEVFSLIDEKSGKPLKDPLRDVLRKGVALGPYNHTELVSRSGNRFPIENHLTPIKEENGKISGAVIIFHDISERRNVEQELRKAQKLESVGLLAGGIAHDFNNILTAITGNLSLLKRHLPADDNIYLRLSQAENAAARAQDLTQQLLTFAKGGAPVRKKVSLAEMVVDTTCFALRGSNIRSEFRIPDDLWPVDVDAGQISQVIHNLVINASQAMPGGGVVEVSCENLSIKDISSKYPSIHKTGSYVKITIADEGIGIPAEFLDRIFDPFFTTKQKGSGLGLATSYSIISKHDGYITVDSQIGKGSVFCVYLPANPGLQLPVASSEKQIRNGEGHILLMDDEELILDITSTMLRDMGYTVRCAKNGEQAIEVFRDAQENGKPFDVVIMDLTIPGGMGGKEAICRLLELDPGVKAIVSSGYSSDPVMADYRKWGFTGILAKPYRISDLSNILVEILQPDREKHPD